MPISEDTFPSGNLLDISSRRWTLSNSCGASIQIIAYGATITSFKVPARDGEIVDIVLGYDDLR